MPEIPRPVTSLERDVRGIFGDRLQSIVVYGLHAADALDRTIDDQSSSHHDERLTHTMVVVDALSSDDLRTCAERAHAWEKAGLAIPLLLAANEFRDALDAFPLEFGAILADHFVVAGSDPFDGLTVNPADARRACEVQARSHLLHLREGYLESRGRPDAVAVLLVRSAPAFAALVNSVARLGGFDSTDALAVSRHIERTLNIAPGAASDIVKLALATEVASPEAVRLFPVYLKTVEQLVKYVDGWGAR